MKREPIEDRWKSTLWENNPELLEYTSSLERKLKIAEEVIKNAEVIAKCYSEMCKALSDIIVDKESALSQIEQVGFFLESSEEALSAIMEE